MKMNVTRKISDVITPEDLQALVASGKHLTEFQDGDVLEIGGIEHIIIGRDVEEGFTHSLTLQRHNKIFDRRFDRYSNVYETSEIRRYLNGEYKDTLPAEFVALVQPVMIDGMKDKDLFFLLSSDDLDLTESKYPFYHKRENRTHYDDEGFAAWYWLRGPYAGYSYGVRYYDEDGIIYLSDANDAGRGLAPACIIGTI